MELIVRLGRRVSKDHMFFVVFLSTNAIAHLPAFIVLLRCYFLSLVFRLRRSDQIKLGKKSLTSKLALHFAICVCLSIFNTALSLNGLRSFALILVQLGRLATYFKRVIHCVLMENKCLEDNILFEAFYLY